MTELFLVQIWKHLRFRSPHTAFLCLKILFAFSCILILQDDQAFLLFWNTISKPENIRKWHWKRSQTFPCLIFTIRSKEELRLLHLNSCEICTKIPGNNGNKAKFTLERFQKIYIFGVYWPGSLRRTIETCWYVDAKETWDWGL